MTALPDEDEFTRLVDAQFNRVDLVKTGANGAPTFLIAKQDGESSGLFDAGYVRDLIAKDSEAAPGGSEENVTVSGSPAAIAKLIHDAGVRRAEPDEIAKKKNDAADRRKKAASGAAMPDGSYPIADESDLHKAIHAVGRGGSSHNAIRRHIISRARSLGASSAIPDNWNSDGSIKESVSKADPVAKDAGDMLDAQTDDGFDGMDPTVPLAQPEDDDAPGDPTDPGSPAWEAVDAATAQKWCSILSRAKNALDLLKERELLEAASADPDDAGNALDLCNACEAIDFAIGVLAPFAVAEQSEADCGADDLMAAIGKAAAGLEGPLARFEPLAAVAKAGRVLSAANEALVRTAGESLSKVLASLPSAPIADEVAKETAVEDGSTQDAPDSVAKDSDDQQARDTAPVAAGGTTGMGEPRGEPQQALPGDVPGRQVIKAGLEAVVYDKAGVMCRVDPERIGEQIAKADGADGEKAKMVAVFDAKGDLVGVCDPADITPVAGADAPAANEEDDDDDDDGKAAAPPADAGDMTPQPAAATGLAAEDVAKSDAEDDDPQAVLKSIVATAMHEVLDADPAKEEIRKQAELIAGQSQEIEALKARLATVEETPAAPKVFTNGAVPPPGTMRGQDRAPAGGQPADVAKAAELKRTLYTGTAAEQNDAFREMQEAAIAGLAAIHGR